MTQAYTIVDADATADAPPRLPAVAILDTVTRYFPVEHGYSCPVTVVVLVGQPGAYTARIGHGDPEWVAEQGEVVSFALARGWFNGLRFEDYEKA